MKREERSDELEMCCSGINIQAPHLYLEDSRDSIFPVLSVESVLYRENCVRAYVRAYVRAVWLV